MGKLLFWIAVVIVVLFVIRLINHQKAKERQQPKAPEKPSIDKAEEMVRCSHCGVYLPRSDALLKDGQLWCSQEHASLGARKL